jgi:hypothetical protein
MRTSQELARRFWPRFKSRVPTRARDFGSTDPGRSDGRGPPSALALISSLQRISANLINVVAAGHAAPMIFSRSPAESTSTTWSSSG